MLCTHNRIILLEHLVANQIAAGEVIERPASVVKELLENAIDAGASEINIVIEYGGLNLITISDNGAGIHAEDLQLALTAHATSKIKSLYDLASIKSMGFRGEALASIAAIAQVTLSSRTVDDPCGMQIVAYDGKYQLTPCARSYGTTVIVKDIFYNAPVRKRFLKSMQQEFAAIVWMVKRIALSAPWIAIRLVHQDAVCLQIPAGVCEHSVLSRIRKLLGKAFLQASKYLEVSYDGIKLRGWFSGLAYQRSQSDGLWMYLNQRMIKDKILYHAIKQAYQEHLHPGKHPTCLVYLTIPLHQVDVNVHPTKYEVRFTDPRIVHDFVYSQVSALLPSAVEPPQHSNLRDPVEPSASMPPVKEQTVLIKPYYQVYVYAEQCYLFNRFKLYQLIYQEWLLAHPRPWAHRALAVVVRVKCSNIAYFDDISVNLFTQLGFKVRLDDGNYLCIQAVPAFLAQLPIDMYFTACVAKCLVNELCVIQELAAVLAQTHDGLAHMTIDAIEYIQTNSERLLSMRGVCVALTTTLCQELLCE